MKTIEERAEEYIYKMDCSEWTDVEDYARHGYEQGATDEHSLLTEWHDPKKELPKTDVEVLCMVHRPANEIQFNTYEVCRYDKAFGWWVMAPIPQGGWCGADREIIAWREIHE